MLAAPTLGPATWRRCVARAHPRVPFTPHPAAGKMLFPLCFWGKLLPYPGANRLASPRCSPPPLATSPLPAHPGHDRYFGPLGLEAFFFPVAIPPCCAREAQPAAMHRERSCAPGDKSRPRSHRATAPLPPHHHHPSRGPAASPPGGVKNKPFCNIDFAFPDCPPLPPPSLPSTWLSANTGRDEAGAGPVPPFPTVPPSPPLCLHPKASDPVPAEPRTSPMPWGRPRSPSPCPQKALRVRFPREILETSHVPAGASGGAAFAGCWRRGWERVCEGGRGEGRAAFRRGGDPCRPARRPGWWESLGTRRCSPWRCRRWGPPRPWRAASDSPPAPRVPPAPGRCPWRSPAR